MFRFTGIVIACILTLSYVLGSGAGSRNVFETTVFAVIGLCVLSGVLGSIGAVIDALISERRSSRYLREIGYGAPVQRFNGTSEDAFNNIRRRMEAKEHGETFSPTGNQARVDAEKAALQERIRKAAARPLPPPE